MAFLLAGCASQTAQRCPVGQEPHRTAQLFFGQRSQGRPWVSETVFRKFVDEELTTRFPDGLTVMEGGGQWKGRDDKLIREAAKVVLIVLPKGDDAQGRLDAVRQAYRARFDQDAVLRVDPPACAPS
ncbi:MAG TPA: DUF3574 domain-containing protein [Phenylobacterium sp.]|nr:DUF3574 domain-containing protein [Phenylobacterium sp.]